MYLLLHFNVDMYYRHYGYYMGISVLSVYLRKLVGTHADQFNFQDYKHTDMVCLTALLHYCILFTVLVQIVPKQENFSDCGVFLCRVRL